LKTNTRQVRTSEPFSLFAASDDADVSRDAQPVSAAVASVPHHRSRHLRQPRPVGTVVAFQPPVRSVDVLTRLSQQRIHTVRTIATNKPVAWCVCKSVCSSPFSLSRGCRPAKTAERIEVLFGSETPRSHEVAEGSDEGEYFHCIVYRQQNSFFRIIRQVSPDRMRPTLNYFSL